MEPNRSSAKYSTMYDFPCSVSRSLARKDIEASCPFGCLALLTIINVGNMTAVQTNMSPNGITNNPMVIANFGDSRIDINSAMAVSAVTTNTQGE